MGQAKSPDKNPVDRARDKALRLLGVRNRSSRELRQRLLADGFSESVSDQVLQSLQDSGLVNDHRFAIERARAMGKGKGWGPRKLRSDLIQRGVSAEVAEEAIGQAYGKQSCDQIMRRQVKKRFGSEVLSSGADRKIRGKALRFLLQKGFEPDEVYSLFGQD
jgi:regulatory protein